MSLHAFTVLLTGVPLQINKQQIEVLASAFGVVLSVAELQIATATKRDPSVSFNERLPPFFTVRFKITTGAQTAPYGFCITFLNEADALDFYDQRFERPPRPVSGNRNQTTAAAADVADANSSSSSSTSKLPEKRSVFLDAFGAPEPSIKKEKHHHEEKELKLSNLLTRLQQPLPVGVWMHHPVAPNAQRFPQRRFFIQPKEAAPSSRSPSLAAHKYDEVVGTLNEHGYSSPSLASTSTSSFVPAVAHQLNALIVTTSACMIGIDEWHSCFSRFGKLRCVAPCLLSMCKEGEGEATVWTEVCVEYEEREDVVTAYRWCMDPLHPERRMATGPLPILKEMIGASKQNNARDKVPEKPFVSSFLRQDNTTVMEEENRTFYFHLYHVARENRAQMKRERTPTLSDDEAEEETSDEDADPMIGMFPFPTSSDLKITRRIANGNNGTLYAGDVGDANEVAIKIAKPGNFDHLNNEVACLKRVSEAWHQQQHGQQELQPFIPSIISYGPASTTMITDNKKNNATPLRVLVMELLGSDLQIFKVDTVKLHLQANQRANQTEDDVNPSPCGFDLNKYQREMSGIVRGMVEALRLVHRAGLIHYSVKPENFCLKRGQCTSSSSSSDSLTPAAVGPNDVRIIDFGRSETVDSFAPGLLDEGPFTGWWYSDAGFSGQRLTQLDDLVSLCHAIGFLLCPSDAYIEHRQVYAREFRERFDRERFAFLQGLHQLVIPPTPTWADVVARSLRLAAKEIGTKVAADPSMPPHIPPALWNGSSGGDCHEEQGGSPPPPLRQQPLLPAWFYAVFTLVHKTWKDRCFSSGTGGDGTASLGVCGTDGRTIEELYDEILQTMEF